MQLEHLAPEIGPARDFGGVASTKPVVISIGVGLEEASKFGKMGLWMCTGAVVKRCHVAGGVVLPEARSSTAQSAWTLSPFRTSSRIRLTMGRVARLPERPSPAALSGRCPCHGPPSSRTDCKATNDVRTSTQRHAPLLRMCLSASGRLQRKPPERSSPTSSSVFGRTLRPTRQCAGRTSSTSWASCPRRRSAPPWSGHEQVPEATR